VLVDGTFNVLEMCVKHKIKKLVLASSASVYGDALKLPMDESHPFNNVTAYGAGKIANEAVTKAFGDMYGLKYIMLRYFSVYGSRMDVTGVYTEVMVRFIDKLEAGEQPTIYGDGKQTIDMVYVEDVARANVMALKSDVSGEVFNIASGKETSVNELFTIIRKILGKDGIEPIYKPHPGKTHVLRRRGDATKIKKMLGFVPEITPEEGFRRLIGWKRGLKDE
jgi:UDP-glucose 4-epimerase